MFGVDDLCPALADEVFAGRIQRGPKISGGDAGRPLGCGAQIRLGGAVKPGETSVVAQRVRDECSTSRISSIGEVLAVTQHLLAVRFEARGAHAATRSGIGPTQRTGFMPS